MLSLPHTVLWDDQHATNQVLDAATMLRRLADVLGAELVEKSFRGEARYELRRVYGEHELRIVAGHIYDTREVLSLVVELRLVDSDRPLASCHLSSGVERVKAADGVAWLRAPNGLVVIVGEASGGLLEIQN